MTEETKQTKQEYLELKIPLWKFTERDEIKSTIAKSPLFDKGKNSRELSAAFAYAKKLLEEINFMQTGIYREILMQRTFVKRLR